MLFAVGHEEVGHGTDAGADEPGERGEGVQRRDEGDQQREEGGRDEGGDGPGVEAVAVEVGAGGVLGVELGDVDPGASQQPVVGHDDAEQRAEQGTQSAQEVHDHGRVVVEVPRQDDQADGGADQAGAAEVQLLGKEVGQRVDGGHEVGHQVHGDGQHQQRQRGGHQQEGVGYGLDDVGGTLNDGAVDLELAPAMTTTMTPKNSMLMGMPQKLPLMMDCGWSSTG